MLTEAPASLSVGPAIAAMVPPAEHTLTAHVVDGGGAPMPGAPVDFSISSGPNAGIAAERRHRRERRRQLLVCGQRPGCRPDPATLADGSANPSQAEATAVWDADCNANAIPDTCDLSCDGFDGTCAAFAGCGGSLDADSTGLARRVRRAAPPPEPSNAPPDCSAASVTPALMVRPDHRFREVAIGGVSDPDGDPVHVVVDAVFQDEPVDTGHLRPLRRGCDGCRRRVVKLRAESRERGDGRVYHLAFSADDGQGGSCSGEVVVCVPRWGWRRSDGCVDQGPLLRLDAGRTASPRAHLVVVAPSRAPRPLVARRKRAKPARSEPQASGVHRGRSRPPGHGN